MCRSLHLASEQDTEDLGAHLAQAVSGSGIIYLQGELGAGKTTLARGFLHALGYRGAVKSPTYTLIEPYELNHRRIFHLDLYRLSDPDELEFIGLRDLLDGEALLLVEWPERGQGVLPEADLDIQLNYAAEARYCRVQAFSELGTTLLGRLKLTG